MISFFNKCVVFSIFQLGFLEKHSTVHVLMFFAKKVSHTIDKSSHTVGIFLYFFDTINHKILLYKLSRYVVWKRPWSGSGVTSLTDSSMYT